ncbi:MAG TPA: VWA domain-containing protein [Bryobacteraceae bacterium]|nr:VWA domain-containing protein [Bryobacteraceae bacterium]
MRSRVFVLGFALMVWTASAQDHGVRVRLTPRPRPAGAKASLRVDVGLTLIPVTVTNALGAPYGGLNQNDFRLFEDGLEQQLKYFTFEDAPVSLGVVFDASSSMTGKLEQSQAAVGRFLRTAVTGDEFFLVEFNNAPRLLSGFTSDTAYLEKTLSSIQPKNWTALFDAVYVAVQQVKRGKNARHALLILSDGGDNYSRYTESEMKGLVREADVCIYSIGLVGGGLLRRHIKVLQKLSAETGGHYYEAEKTDDLPEAVSRISEAIRNQYVLGYVSRNPNNNGLYRRIEVKLTSQADRPRLRVSWRAGYYASTHN